MQLPNEIVLLLNAYVARFSIPSGPPGDGKDDAARQWSRRFAEQVAWSRPGEGWGMKSAGGGRPMSKDTLARLTGGRLWIVDLLTGVGTSDTRLSGNREMVEITGQEFMPVTPTNHLETTPQQPEPKPEGPLDLTPLLLSIADFKGDVAANQLALILAVQTGLAEIQRAVKDGVKIRF